MSLVTRCTSCGTVFRVVQDQLRVSEGWVRCGRCDEVFNALEGLFELEPDAPPDGSPTAGHDAERAAPNPEATPFAEVREPVQPGSPPRESIDASPPGSGQFGTAGPATAPQSAPDAELAAVPTPEFLRDARRPSGWQSSRARLAMLVAAALLLLGLTGQIVHHFRDLVSTRWPAVKPALTAWCKVVGCTIAAVRRIEDIAVESTALTRATGPDSYRLTVALRNRGTMVLASPSLELSLTDSSGQLVARRTLGPHDFRDALPTMMPGAESTFQLMLATASSRVTGYTVEVFYP